MVKFKIVEHYDAGFRLDPEARRTLGALLTSEAFIRQICAMAMCDRVEFTELLFQPLPYTVAAPKGMPVEYEPYHNSPDYVIINVPPNFMFQAKIVQPSRLCAIYRVAHLAD